MLCFFHLVHTHERILDETGIEIADPEAARYHAIKAVLEAQKDMLSLDVEWRGWHIEVADASGEVLLVLPLDTLQD